MTESGFRGRVRIGTGAELARVRNLERERHVTALIRSLDSESDGVRLAALWALGRLGDQRAVPAVVECVGDGQWMVRQIACQVLGVMQAGEAEGVLSSALEDPEWRVRSAAAEALGRIGRADTLGRLRDTLRQARDDREPYVRLAVAEALFVLKDEQIAADAGPVIKGLPWTLRRGSRVRRLMEAVRSGEPLLPRTHTWQLAGPRRR